MPHAISSRDGSSSPPTQNVPPRSPRRGRGPARGRRPSCIPSQVSGVEPKAFDSRIAISTEILVRPFTGSESACRVPPSPWAARVTVKSASLSGRRSRQGDLSRASELQLGELGLRLVPCPMVSPSEDCGLDNFFQVPRADGLPPPGRLATGWTTRRARRSGRRCRSPAASRSTSGRCPTGRWPVRSTRSGGPGQEHP